MKLTELEEKYSGQPFIFHSPFHETSGWMENDVGILICQRLHSRGDNVDEEIRDEWLGYNIIEDEFAMLWGGEAHDERGRAIVREHMFIGWKP